MTTAFVLSGGGSLGAVQVGMMRALAERGERPDLLVGASAGALNAAFVGSRGFTGAVVDELASIWLRLRRQHVFPFTPRHHLLACIGVRPSLCSTHGLRALVDAHMGHRTLEGSSIPVHVVATDVVSGTEELLSAGRAGDAVMASAAIPGVFPPVEIDGTVLFDGGVADNTPVSQAVALGADRIIVLPAGVACALDRPPRTALSTAVHAITLLIEQRLVHDVAAWRSHADIVVIPPLCPLSVASVDFRHTAELLDRAHRSTHHWLDAGGATRERPERFLSLHRHTQRGSPAPRPEHATSLIDHRAPARACNPGGHPA